MVMRFIQGSLILLLALSGRAGAAFAAELPPASPPPDIEAFVREGCPHCAKAEEFLARLQQEQPGLRIAIRDVERDPAALERLQRMAESHGLGAARVPAFLVREQLIIGFSDEADTRRAIRDSLVPAKPVPQTYSVGFLGHTVSLDQVGLPLFTLTLGLLDGFNPCSMWVLILMISLLAPMNNRPRMFAIAGTFVVVEGIAYFLFMAAWLNLFLLIGLSRASEIVIAVVALVAGAINLKDFWRFGWGVSLSIPVAAKPRIYARMRGIVQADHLAAALIGSVVLAVLVQIVELMCTSGFPALFTRILTQQQLDRPAYYGYLMLYDVAYMLDDMIVLAIGVITLSQHRLQENEGRWLKLGSGLVMVGLGIYLLVPH